MKALAWFDKDTGTWWIQHPGGLKFFADSLDNAWRTMDEWIAKYPDAPELGKATG